MISNRILKPYIAMVSFYVAVLLVFPPELAAAEERDHNRYIVIELDRDNKLDSFVVLIVSRQELDDADLSEDELARDINRMQAEYLLALILTMMKSEAKGEVVSSKDLFSSIKPSKNVAPLLKRGLFFEIRSSTPRRGVAHSVSDFFVALLSKEAGQE